MKKILSLVFFASFFMIANAQLVSYQKIDSLSISDLNTLIDNLGYSGFIVPEYPVDVYRVMYDTEYKNGFTEISGLLAVPKDTECKSPLVSYQHGTTSLKYNVPSYGDEKNIVIMYASLGNIVCASDYIGLGASTETLHPYMHAYSQAHSSINLMRSVREMDSQFDFNMSNQIFLFGYSQGGFATAATLKYIELDYSDEFTVTAAAPMSGPYNMAGAQFDMVSSGQPYSTPGYLPYVILGYQSIYGNLYTNPNEIFKSPYDVTMPNLFNDHTKSIDYIGNQMPSDIPTDIIIDSVLQEMINNPNHVFRQALQDNDFLSWTPQSHMKLFYCNGDDQVTYLNATIADSVWNLNGAPFIESTDYGNFDHGGCFPWTLLNGKTYMEAFGNNGVEILVSYDETTNSYTVDVLDDNIADFDILWNDNSTGTTISNIETDSVYIVTLTHKTKGCSNSKSFKKEDIYNSINKIVENIYFTISPNPTNNYLNINIEESKNKTAYIVNALGETVLIKNIENNKTLDISKLSRGIYIIGINGVLAKQKFVKK